MTAVEQKRYVVCNAVDADPKSRVSKFILSDRPGLVVDGLLITASAAGARRAYVCVNEEYAEEIDSLRRAIGELGERADLIDIEIRPIAARLVAGEDAALLAAIDGRQPLPDLRYAAAAATAGASPGIAASAEALAMTGLCSPGVGIGAPGETPKTKVVTVCGDVSRPTTAEITLPTTIRAVIEGLEGKTLEELNVRAVQFGGPTGPFLAAEQLELIISHEALEATGIAMGTGTIEVFADGAGGLDVVQRAARYIADESCGKCPACREGARQMAELVDQLAAEGGTTEERAERLELLCELALAAAEGSICTVGRYSGVPALTGLEVFGGGG
jgi:NADH:ubiquinone oxidoreductase subunit F (NADH-binding)